MTNYKSDKEEEFNFSRNDKNNSVDLQREDKLNFFRVFNLILKIQKNFRIFLNNKSAKKAIKEVRKRLRKKFI